MSETELKCAVIGVGKAGEGTWARGGGHQIGHHHAMFFARSPRCRVSAAADISRENLDFFCDKFEVSPDAGYLDYREMLAREKPDIVSICTYLGLHMEMLEACAEAGVSGVICEKPFLGAPAELARVRRLAENSDMKVVVAHMRRHMPVFRKARDLYECGAVGEPYLMAAGINGWDLAEWGSHWIDIFRYLHGDAPVRHVFGQGRVTDARGYGHAMEDHAICFFEFEGGGRALLDAGSGLNGEGDSPGSGLTMSLAGTHGTIRIYDCNELVLQNQDGQQAFDCQHDSAKLWDDLLAELISWMDGGPEPGTSHLNIAKTSEVYLAAYLSMLRGDRIDLPLQDDLDCWPLDALAANRKS